jgi:hypothetical protein
MRGLKHPKTRPYGGSGQYGKRCASRGYHSTPNSDFIEIYLEPFAANLDLTQEDRELSLFPAVAHLIFHPKVMPREQQTFSRNFAQARWDLRFVCHPIIHRTRGEAQ